MHMNIGFNFNFITFIYNKYRACFSIGIYLFWTSYCHAESVILTDFNSIILEHDIIHNKSLESGIEIISNKYKELTGSNICVTYHPDSLKHEKVNINLINSSIMPDSMSPVRYLEIMAEAIRFNYKFVENGIVIYKATAIETVDIWIFPRLRKYPFIDSKEDPASLTIKSLIDGNADVATYIRIVRHNLPYNPEKMPSGFPDYLLSRLMAFSEKIPHLDLEKELNDFLFLVLYRVLKGSVQFSMFFACIFRNPRVR